MQFPIFSKKATNADGRKFDVYFGRIMRKDGTTLPVTVKFRESCGAPNPEDCPMNIVVDKSNANLASREFNDKETGEVRTSFTLWVKGWDEGVPYVDHSLDDFDD